MIARCLKFILFVPERARVEAFRLGRLSRRLRIPFVALRYRAGVLATAVLGTSLVLAVDAIAYPILKNSPAQSLLSSLSIAQEALAAIIAGLAAVLGLLVTIYAFMFQLSAQRLNATDRMLQFFRDEPVTSTILDFLTFSIVFSLLTLLGIGVRDFTPYVSIVISVLLAIVSVVLIVVYLRRAAELTEPGFVFRNIAAETVEHLDHLSKRAHHGPSIESHLNRVVARQLDLFEEFVTVFAGGDQVARVGVERKEAAAAEGMMALLSILQRYVEMKRFIPARSYWFPRRDRPLSANGSYSRQGFVSWARLEALGQLPETVVERDWLEERLLGFTERVFTKAVDAELRLLLTSIPVMCRDLMLTALQVQEFELVESVAKRAIFPYLERISERQYPGAGEEMYNAIWHVWHALLEDDGSTAFLEGLPGLPWLDTKKMTQLDLPLRFRQDVLALEDMLEYEVLVEGRLISPVSELVEYCRQHSVGAVVQSRRASQELFHRLLTSRMRGAIESDDGIQLANALRMQMILVRQLMLRGSEETYQRLIPGTLATASQALAVLSSAAQADPDALGELVSEAYHFAINMIVGRCFDHLGPMLALYVQLRLAAEPKADDRQHANEELIVLASLALLYSEIDQETEPFNTVLGIYQEALNLNVLADVLEAYLSDWQHTIPWITRYHEYFKGIQEEMRRLPERSVAREGARSFLTVPDHPSPIIEKLAGFAARPAMEGAAYYVYLRICDILGREHDEKTHRLH